MQSCVGRYILELWGSSYCHLSCSEYSFMTLSSEQQEEEFCTAQEESSGSVQHMLTVLRVKSLRLNHES